jgi:hypothetical protein
MEKVRRRPQETAAVISGWRRCFYHLIHKDRRKTAFDLDLDVAAAKAGWPRCGSS